MVKRLSLSDAPCPVARALDVIGDWWSLLVIRDAFDGLRRFSQFESSLGISKATLTARLRLLTERGILAVAPASDGSAYHDYVLTRKGRDLYLVIVALRQWGEDHLYQPGEAHSELLDRDHNQPVARLSLAAQDGRPLGWDDTWVAKVTKPKGAPDGRS